MSERALGGACIIALGSRHSKTEGRKEGRVNEGSVNEKSTKSEERAASRTHKHIYLRTPFVTVEVEKKGQSSQQGVVGELSERVRGRVSLCERGRKGRTKVSSSVHSYYTQRVGEEATCKNTIRLPLVFREHPRVFLYCSTLPP